MPCLRGCKFCPSLEREWSKKGDRTNRGSAGTSIEKMTSRRPSSLKRRQLPKFSFFQSPKRKSRRWRARGCWYVKSLGSFLTFEGNKVSALKGRASTPNRTGVFQSRRDLVKQVLIGGENNTFCQREFRERENMLIMGGTNSVKILHTERYCCRRGLIQSDDKKAGRRRPRREMG